MSSARFLTLSRRVRQLRKRFIPRVFSPTGVYSARQRDYARAYRLLVHAELESYLEDRSKEVVVCALKRFKRDGKPLMLLLNLLGFHSKSHEWDAAKLKEIYAKGANQLIEALNGASGSYHHTILKNHGVREDDVLRILMPLGFQKADLDSVLLATLDSFGINRGEVAHTSIKAQTLIDPKTETDTVELILVGLETVDTKLTSILKTCK